MTDKQLISIESFRITATNSAVSANFGEMRQVIIKTIADHKSLVTPETIQGGKTLAADFRKTSKALMAAWKEKRAVSIADVLKADDEVKSLCKLLDEGADEISDQVKAIEAETKELCADLLKQELLSQWETLGVENEFRKSSFIDMALLGNINKDKLTKGAKTEIATRASLDKAMQDKIASRLNELELRCLKNDIVPSLSRSNVEHFLFADDFSARLDSIISAEISRKAEAERRMREKLEAEKQKAIDDALKAQQAEANRLAKLDAEKQRAIEAEQRAESERLAKEEAEKVRREQINALALELSESTKRTVEEIKPEETNQTPVPTPDDAVTYTITALVNFKIQSKPNADIEKMKNYFTDVFQKEGKQVVSISIKK
jgi:Protein of unknown function (DUF1351)